MTIFAKSIQKTIFYSAILANDLKILFDHFILKSQHTKMPLINIPQEMPSVITPTYRERVKRDFPLAKKVESLNVNEKALLPVSQIQDIGDIDIEKLKASGGRARKNINGEAPGYTLQDLKNYAQKHKIEVTGSKQDLITKILNYLISHGLQCDKLNC